LDEADEVLVCILKSWRLLVGFDSLVSVILAIVAKGFPFWKLEEN